jgi:hypothetical protein
MNKIWLIFCFLSYQACAQDNNKEHWIQLFNGKDLDNWQVKFKGQELGVNYKNTFRVENGILKVDYTNHQEFDGNFGHLFYNQEFSHYILRAEYRFVGEQVPNGPDWAVRNNGFMIHSQSAASMGLDQDFPISIEAQLLGGIGDGPRQTNNLCTPGTNVVLGDSLFTNHCISSTSKTYDGDQWVEVSIVVFGDSLIHHLVEGDTVLTYYKPQIGGGVVNGYDPAIKQDGQLLEKGFIAIQAESAPTEFRKIELLELKPEP